MRKATTFRSIQILLAATPTLIAAPAGAEALPAPPSIRSTPTNQSPQDLVDALRAAFGNHHARAVHTKGVIMVGSFTPAAEAPTLCAAPIFTDGTLPIVARFSVFAGIPQLPDNAAPSSPSGLALKIKAKDGNDFDVVTNNHNGFIVATTDEFAAFLRALAASGPSVAHPTPVEQFMAAHPVAKAFSNSLTYPVSYATATFFGVNSFKLTNAKGTSVFARYRVVPRAGEHYLKPEELKAQGPNYLQDEIVARVGKAPIMYDWYAQIADKDDKIEDPSIAWPDTRKLVKLGTFTITAPPKDAALADRTTLYLPGQPHPGIEPADPMLSLRNKAYPISFQGRQSLPVPK